MYMYNIIYIHIHTYIYIYMLAAVVRSFSSFNVLARFFSCECPCLSVLVSPLCVTFLMFCTCACVYVCVFTK